MINVIELQDFWPSTLTLRLKKLISHTHKIRNFFMENYSALLKMEYNDTVFLIFTQMMGHIMNLIVGLTIYVKKLSTTLTSLYIKSTK